MDGPAHVDVAIVGGGASGALVAAHLAGRSALPPTATVAVFDPRPELGRGVAYSTASPCHLLNVPAGRLGAAEDDPDDFVRWLRDRVTPAAGPADFVPRAHYGRYLGELVHRRFHAAGAPRLRHVRETVVGWRAGGGRAELELGSGARVLAERTVLACGQPGTRADWAPAALRGCAAWVPDPWAEAADERLRGGRSVLLVGTGLTMVDMALTLARPGVTLTALSPSGRLPTSHRSRPSPPVPPPPELAGCHDAPGLRRLVRSHLTHRRAGGDWRPAIDGLRPVTSALWRRLPEPDKRALLDSRSWWNRHRHRMPPPSADGIARLRRSGQLRLRRGTIVDARPGPSGVRLRLSDGTELGVDTVVNCTGPQPDPRTGDDPLIRALLRTGLARPGPVDLGLATTEDGQLVGALGRPTPGLYTLGPPRVGELWESTAIPEIRRQAAALAALLAETPVRPAGAGEPVPTRGRP